MAYFLDHNVECIPGKQKSYYCDTAADIADLPTSSQEGAVMGDSVTHLTCAPGSFCLCIGDSSGWILNSEDQWIEV